MRHEGHARNKSINDLILEMYLNPQCILHYGMLEEHMHSLFVIIINEIKKKDTCFKKYLENGGVPSNDEIRKYLTPFFSKFYQQNCSAKKEIKECQLELDFYPLTNISMSETPPQFDSWIHTEKGMIHARRQMQKQQQGQHQHNPTTYCPALPQYHPAQIPPGARSLQSVVPNHVLHNSPTSMSAVSEEDNTIHHIVFKTSARERREWSNF